MIPPLIQEVLGAELQSSAIPTEEAKIFPLPPTLIALIHEELREHGHALPATIEDGDVLVLRFADQEVELVPATVH